MTFSNAIVRTPGPSMVHGLTSADLGKPDFETALNQHAAYIQALKACGLQVTVLPADDTFPDSTFVEDTALVTRACAIITRPGAPSRRDETGAIEAALRGFFPVIERVTAPGTVDAGDIIMVGNHFYIGLSQRTDTDGAAQVIRILARYGMTGSTIPLQNVLHLKSGVTWLERGRMVTAGEFIGRPEFAAYMEIRVDDDEQYAANCLYLNGTVLIATGYPKLKRAIAACGYRTMALDLSEFRKLDGGLSCLSLRF
jgi:dimethylargininase